MDRVHELTKAYLSEDLIDAEEIIISLNSLVCPSIMLFELIYCILSSIVSLQLSRMDIIHVCRKT
jgi:hypothetical protein